MADFLWLTGPSGSGKSTIARALKQKAFTVGYKQCILLDADEVRTLWPQLGFDKNSVDENVFKIAKLANMVGSQLVDRSLVVIACISPNQDSRNKSISLLEENPGRVILAHLFTPLKCRIERDPKGLYQKVADGEIQNLAGYDAPYDVPLVCKRFDGTKDISAIVHQILQELL